MQSSEPTWGGRLSDAAARVSLCLQVFLTGYSHAFRYCPGDQQVEYREASRTPHEGALEYISVDSHKGAGEWTTVP